MADERSRPAVPRQKGWRPDAAATAAKRSGPSGRGKKVFTLLAIMLALAGVLVGFLWYIRPFHPPVFLSLPVTEYTDQRYPANAFGQQDGKALLERFHLQASGLALPSQQGNLLREKLDELHNRKDDSFVLHVSSLAVCREGKVYMLPADADADRPETWLPLDSLLQAMRACPALRKLLILDVMKPVADPRLGILRNDVATQVEQAIKELPDCPYWVLCACSAGQVSLVSEDLRRSVFGYFLDQGLRGKADHFGPTGKADGRITVHELADYVTARVDHWAVANRDTRQTPVLLGSGEDFELALAEKNTDAPADELDDAYPTLLQQGWKVRDGWLQDGGLHDGPGVIGSLETTLLWAEKRWRGGLEFERVSENPRMKLAAFEDQMHQALPGEAPHSRSLAVAVAAAKQEPDAKTVMDLKDLVQEAAQVPKAKDWAAKVAAFLKTFDQRPLALAEAAYIVAQDDPQMETLRFLGDLLKGNPASTPYSETILLLRLAGFDAKRWPAPKATRHVRLLLRLSRQSEKAINCDPALFPWIADALETALDKKREGERRLFSGDPDKVDEAGPLLEEADLLLTIVARRSKAFEEALRLLGEALEFLPGDAFFLMNRPTPNERDLQSWLAAAQVCRDLHDLLANPPSTTTFPPAPSRKPDAEVDAALGQYTQSLKDRLQSLGKPFLKKNIEALIQQNHKQDASPATFLEIEALLHTPLLQGEDRFALWKAGLTLSRKLHEQSAAASNNQLTVVASEADRRKLSGLEKERVACRAQLSIGLMRLGGLDGAGDLEQTRQRLPADPAAPAWEALGDKLRIAWNRQAPARMKELVAKENWAEAACLGHVTPSLRPGELQGDMAAKLHRRQAQRAWQWIGRRYGEEAKSFPDAPVAAAFYQRASDEFLQFAR